MSGLRPRISDGVEEATVARKSGRRQPIDRERRATARMVGGEGWQQWRHYQRLWSAMAASNRGIGDYGSDGCEQQGHRRWARLMSLLAEEAIGEEQRFSVFLLAGHPWLGCGQGQPAWEASNARKGRQPPAAAVARKGGAYGQKHRPWAQPLAARRPLGGPATGRPQGAARSRGDGAGHSGGCPLAGRLPGRQG
ncbi:hypothetical protein BHE74_00042506 [Ensete ventricosum]|nr:hypothetical protein BHE74_00042506 [Ensete ventricosum]